MNFLNPWTSRSRCYQNGTPSRNKQGVRYSWDEITQDGGGQLEHGT